MWAKNSSYIPLLTPQKRQKTDQVVQKKGQKNAHNFSKGQKNLWAKYEECKKQIKKKSFSSGKLV